MSNPLKGNNEWSLSLKVEPVKPNLMGLITCFFIRDLECEPTHKKFMT